MSKTRQNMEHQLLPLSWDTDENGALTVHPDNGPLALTGLLGSVQADGAIVSLADAHVDTFRETDERGCRQITTAFAITDPALTWVRDVVVSDSILTIENRIENRGEDDLRIGAFNVLDGQGRQLIDLGTDPEQIRFFGWRSWNMGVERLAEAKSRHVSSNLCHLYDPTTQTTVLCSFLTLDRMLVGHTLDYTREDGVTGYRASCSTGGYRLKPGEILKGEILQISYHRDPYEALEDWAQRIHAHYKPDLDERPLVIWSGGAWLDGFSANEDDWETLALENGKAIQKELAGFGFTHIWTSQNNLKDGLPGNWLVDNREQIPSGLAGFLNKAREMGIDHKLWFSPFWFFSEAEGILEENRENLLVDESGEPIAEPGDWEWDVDTDDRGTSRLTKYYLDGTHPQTQAYVRKIFETYRAMGANAYMLDFLAIKEGARLHDDSLLPVTTGWDDYLLVAVYNDEGEGYEGRLDFGRLGLDPGTTWRVFEFWNEEYAGTFRESCPCAVPSGAIRLYRISAARSHPWLLSTDMHILQGGTEIGVLSWDEATQTLSGAAVRPTGERGNLFLHLPRQYRLINHRGVNLMKEVLDMTAMARTPIEFTEKRVEFEYRFERIDVPHVSHRYWLPYKTVEEWKAYVAENRTSGDTRVVE